MQDDVARAAAARATRLARRRPAVGTALRALNGAGDGRERRGRRRRAHRARERVRGSAAARRRSRRRCAAHAACRPARGLPRRGRALRGARASRAEELDELAGAFIDRMSAAGWVEGGKVLLDDAARRAAFKLVWNALARRRAHCRELALALDEQRALYTFYLTHPHAPEAQRARLRGDAPRRDRRATTCEQRDRRGAARQRSSGASRRSGGSARSIRRTRRPTRSVSPTTAPVATTCRSRRSARGSTTHPDGPLALRARNHLKAALAAYGPS